MGVHLIDSYIEIFGRIEEVYCQSIRRAVPNDTDDVSAILFRFANGMTGDPGTPLAGSPTYRFATYGTPGTITPGWPDMSAMEIGPADESDNPDSARPSTKKYNEVTNHAN